jgi:cobalamin biosynthesis protein CobD/CbiB
MGSIPTWGWVIFLLVAFDDILLWFHSPYLAIPLTLILVIILIIFVMGGKSTANNLVNTARKGASNLLANMTTRAASQMLKRD